MRKTKSEAWGNVREKTGQTFWYRHPLQSGTGSPQHAHVHTKQGDHVGEEFNVSNLISREENGDWLRKSKAQE